MLDDKIREYEKTKKMLKNTPAMYKREYPFLKEVDSLALEMSSFIWKRHIYHCECGNKMDRDHNAAINIREEARSLRLKIRDLSGGSMSRKYKENANENNYKPQVPDVMEAIFDVVYLVFDLIAAILFLYFQKEICYLFFMEY